MSVPVTVFRVRDPRCPIVKPTPHAYIIIPSRSPHASMKSHVQPHRRKIVQIADVYTSPSRGGPRRPPSSAGHIHGNCLRLKDFQPLYVHFEDTRLSKIEQRATRAARGLRRILLREHKRACIAVAQLV